MTIACPHDPRLPRLAAALDADHVAQRLDARLRALGQGDRRVLEARPAYIRYKPGTNAVVQYQLRLHDRSGVTWSPPVAFALYPGDHAAQLAARRRTRELSARLPAGPWPLGGVWAEQSLGALAQGFPFDRAIPGLASAVDPLQLADLISRGRPTEPAPDGLTITLLRHKPGRRAVLRAAAGDGRCWYLKAGPELRPALLTTLAAALAERGLRTPAIVAADPDRGLVLQQGLAGRSLMGDAGARTVRGAEGVQPPAADLAKRICAQLRVVQGLDPHRLPGLRAWDPLPVLARAVAALAPLRPLRAATLARLAARLEEAWGRLAPRPPVLVHGDFYEDQILFDPRQGPALLDWDEAGLGPAALDAACWLAHARAAAHEGETAPVAAEQIRAAWLAARPADARQLDLLACVQLLALAPGPFRRLEAYWPEAVDRRLCQVDLLLRAAEAVTSGAPRRLLAQTTPSWKVEP